MLFILAVDPLHSMIELASEQVMPTPIGSQELNLHISLYADDAAIFINPVCQNWTPFATSSTLLDRLLGCKKSSILPISCEGVDIDQIILHFPGQLLSFPCRYLSLKKTHQSTSSAYH